MEPVVETERLILRHLTLEDVDELTPYYADPEVRRFFPEGTLTRDEVAEKVAWYADVVYPLYGYGLWATVRKDTGALIGRCGLIPWKVIARGPGLVTLESADEAGPGANEVEAEVAYMLGRAHHGLGFATEAAKASVAHAFGSIGLDRVICLVDPENVASLRVAEKVGFTPDGDVIEGGERFPLFSIARGSG